MSQFHGVRRSTAHKHRWGSTPVGSGCVPVTRTGVKANKYFYIREIRCQAEPGSFETALVRSSAKGNGCQEKRVIRRGAPCPCLPARFLSDANEDAASRVSTTSFSSTLRFRVSGGHSGLREWPSTRCG